MIRLSEFTVNQSYCAASKRTKDALVEVKEIKKFPLERSRRKSHDNAKTVHQLYSPDNHISKICKVKPMI